MVMRITRNSMWMRTIIITGPSGSVDCGFGDAQCFTTYEDFRGLGCCFISGLLGGFIILNAIYGFDFI